MCVNTPKWGLNSQAEACYLLVVTDTDCLSICGLNKSNMSWILQLIKRCRSETPIRRLITCCALAHKLFRLWNLGLGVLESRIARMKGSHKEEVMEKRSGVRKKVMILAGGNPLLMGKVPGDHCQHSCSVTGSWPAQVRAAWMSWVSNPVYSPTACVVFHVISLASCGCAELGDCALPSVRVNLTRAIYSCNLFCNIVMQQYSICNIDINPGWHFLVNV